MSNHSEREKEKEEKRNRERTRKEKLAEYFFAMSNTILGSLIIGVALVIYENGKNYDWWINTIVIITGLIFLVTLAKIGNNILK